MKKKTVPLLMWMHRLVLKKLLQLSEEGKAQKSIQQMKEFSPMT